MVISAKKVENVLFEILSSMLSYCEKSTLQEGVICTSLPLTTMEVMQLWTTLCYSNRFSMKSWISSWWALISGSPMKLWTSLELEMRLQIRDHLLEISSPGDLAYTYPMLKQTTSNFTVQTGLVTMQDYWIS